MQHIDSDAIRVFISSTFLDMKVERDLLIKEVFPSLRRMCDPFGISVNEIDLRWGITEQESEKGETLPLCLSEIERCRPFFICMLGERYGWVPTNIPEDLITHQPWLAEHQQQSVTALEIIHGVLRHRGKIENALFYFRDPKYLESLPQNEQNAFRENPSPEEIKSLGLSSAKHLAEQRARMLADLKDVIRASGARIFDGYSHPADFARQVAKDLADIIRPLLPLITNIDSLDRESTAHKTFARRRAKGYMFHQSDRHLICSFLSGQGNGFIVSGGAGVGKTAFLSATSEELVDKNETFLVLTHFVDATAGSANWEIMLRRMIHELSLARNKLFDQPANTESLPTAFARALHETATNRQIVIIVDAVDQLEDREGSRELAWVPVSLPSTVKFVISSGEGPTLEAARRRDWHLINLSPLEDDRRRKLTEAFLSRYSKRLDKHRFERLVSASQTASPLFLRTILDELRLTAGHDSLDRYLSRYLDAADTIQLFKMVLQRWEDDYSRDRPGWVGSALAMLWASRRGLTESELVELAGSEGSPLPRAYWSMLLYAAGDLLTTRSGMIGFSNKLLGEAVFQRYLPNENSRREIHRRLAKHFANQDESPRQVDELPWHLARAREFAKLKRALSNRYLFMALWNKHPDELRELWGHLESESSYRMVQTYKALIRSPAEDPSMAERVALLFSSTGHLAEARDLLLTLEQCALNFKDNNALESVRGNLAMVQMSLGDHVDALQRFVSIEKWSRDNNDIPALISTLSNKAELLITLGKIEEAEAACKEQEILCRKTDNFGGLYRCLGKMGHLLCLRGQKDKAIDIFREVEMITRQLGDRAGTAAALMDQAFIVRTSGRLHEAINFYREAEHLARQFNAPQQLDSAIGGQAVIHEALGEPEKAMTLYREAEKVSRMAANSGGLYKALHHQSLLLAQNDDLSGALALQQKVEAICRKTGDAHGLYRSLGCQGLMWEQSGDLDKALSLAREAETICDRLGDLDGKQASISAQASVLAQLGQPDKAVSMLAQAVEMCRKLGDPQKLAMALVSQADLMASELADLEGARVLAREALGIAKKFSFHDLKEEANQIINGDTGE